MPLSGISNEGAACFVVLALAVAVVVSVMTFVPLEGRYR
jgi:hypothetical protein